MSDYEASQKRRNMIVGIFVLLGLVAFGWLVFKFGDLPMTVSRFKSYQVIARFSTAPGVQKDTPVRFCGFQIGRVVDVMAPNVLAEIVDGKETERRYHQTVVVMRIDKRFNTIPANSGIKLMTRGLGSSYIEIQSPLPGETPGPSIDVLANGSLMQGTKGMTSEFFPEESQKKLESLVSDLQTFIGNANTILGDRQNQQNIAAILTNVEAASRQAVHTMTKAEETLEVAKSALGSYHELAHVGKNTLQRTDAHLKTLSVSMLTTSEELGKASSQMRLVMEKINTGDGTLGKLVTDARLYEKLLETSEQLQQVIAEVQLSFQGINELGLRRMWSKGVPKEE